MNTDAIRRLSLLPAGLVLAAASIIGCEQGDPGDIVEYAPPPPPQIKPEQQSAEALVARFNELATARPTMDLGGIVRLMTAEDNRQRDVLWMLQTWLPVIEFEQLLWDRFGAGMELTGTEPPLTPIRSPAQITQNFGERADASYRDGRGRPQTLHLVKIGERWWISAST